jgi:hypothetical protein
MILDHVAGQNKKSLQNTERKNVGQFQSYAPLIFLYFKRIFEFLH